MKSTRTPLRSYLTYHDVAEILKVTPRFVRKMAASGQIHTVRIGDCVRISPAEFERFVESLPANR